MGLIAFLILVALQGLVVGAFARLALPGRDPMTILETIALGVGGSVIAGVIVYAIAGSRAAPGFLAALICSVGILYVIRRRRGGGLLDPGTPGGRGRPGVQWPQRRR